MVSQNTEHIVREVKIILDENIETGSVLAKDYNQLEIETLIRSRIVDAVMAVHEEAPSDMIDGGTDMKSQPINMHTGGLGTGYIELPDDFMRLVIFKLTAWRRPVIEPIRDTDPLYFMQKSKFNGIRGGVDKPVCALSTGQNGRILEFYSVPAGETATIEIAKYLALPEITGVDDEGNGMIEISKRLMRPVYYYTAGLVATTLKDPNADKFFIIAKSYYATQSGDVQ